MKKSSIILFSLGLLAAASSTAMSLGQHRGAALIGRPLDISVQAVLDAQEDTANLCLEADIFYADSKLDKSRVRVTVDKALPNGRDALIRIRSSVLIDEPVVTLYLRAGCQHKTERRYVVLADLVSEVASLPATPQPARGSGISLGRLASAGGNTGSPFASPSASSAVAPAVNGPINSASSRSAGRGRSGGVAESVQAAFSGALSASPLVQPLAEPRLKDAAVSSRRKDQRSSAPEKTGARLKLEPLDLTVERYPQLKSSAELLSAPASNEQERSAAAALWRALTAQPQDILRDFEKLQTLENSVRSLQVQARKNQLTIDELNGRVSKAQSEKYANALVYALVGLLLLVSVSLAYVWRQRSLTRERGEGEMPWWRKNKPLEKGWDKGSLEPDSPESPGDFEAPKKGWKKDRQSGLQLLDLDLGPNESHFTEVKQSGQSGVRSKFAPRHREHSDFSMSMPSMARAVKAEELLDVQQQADFFVSLGQHEQAIEVLRSHIGDNVETSALVYLDLFSLYHQLKRRIDYEALRVDFNDQFNAKIPAFELYTYTGPDLEAYQFALSRIEALWPSPKVLEVIEESIFRRPNADAEAFDLEAYRELLLLYAVAKEIISPEVKPSVGVKKFDLKPAEVDDFDFRPLKFMATSIQPLSARADEDEGAPLVTSVLPPPRSSLRSLDLDLTESPNISEILPSRVESDSNFFSQFDSIAPIAPPIFLPTPGSLARPSFDVDNLIDFDPFDSSVKAAQRILPKV